jgi:protein-S-isoprenylcysteine O-methyltransferase Ste14
LAAGGAIFLAGSLVLGRNLSPYTHPRPDAQLVRRGIYQHLRHPLYTGVMCAAIGWALGHTSPVALGVALTLIPFFNAKARAEERWLMKRFPDYADYARRVPRFLPRLDGKANLVCNF